MKPTEKLVVLVSALVALVLPNLSAAAQSGPAGRYLEGRHQEVKRILARGRDNTNPEVTRIISSLLDFEGVSRAALGDHWEEHSAEERREFVNLLRTLVERNYQEQLENTQAYEVTYGSERTRGGIVVVETSARSTENRRAPEVSIEYHMKRQGNRWIVEDVVTDGVSMVRNYRSQFDRIIRRDGWDGLMDRMRSRVQEGS
jgi:phospholipid transport system substrate-binding protein